MRPDRREGSNAGPSCSLFQRPTGLADGLAPKERRYELAIARLAPESPPPKEGFPMVPPPPPGAARGVRQIAAEYMHGSGGTTLVAGAGLCQDLARVRTGRWHPCPLTSDAPRHEALCGHTSSPRARMARRGRDRQDARAPRDADRRRP